MKTRKSRRFQRFTLVGLLALACFYLALSPVVSTSLYEGQFFRPDYCREPYAKLKDCFATRGLEVRKTELFIDTSNGRLHAFWFNLHSSAQGNRAILVHLGAAGNIAARSQLIALLLEAGKDQRYSVFVYEYRGFGESEGSRASLLGVTEDGLAVCDFLQEKGHQPEDLLLYGESLGGAVATHIATRRKVAGIVTQGTFSSLSQVGWDRGMEEWGLPSAVLPWAVFGETFFPPRMNNLAVVSGPGFDVPLLVVHGGLDGIVPVHHALRLFEGARSRHKEILILPQSGHCSLAAPDDEQQFVETVAAFLGKLNDERKQVARSE